MVDIIFMHALVGDITFTHVLLGDIVRIALDLRLACSFTMFKLGAIITVSHAEVGCLADLFSQVAGFPQVSAEQFWICFLICFPLRWAYIFPTEWLVCFLWTQPVCLLWRLLACLL